MYIPVMVEQPGSNSALDIDYYHRWNISLKSPGLEGSSFDKRPSWWGG
jgi:hypothetical protein